MHLPQKGLVHWDVTLVLLSAFCLHVHELYDGAPYSAPLGVAAGWWRTSERRWFVQHVHDCQM